MAEREALGMIEMTSIAIGMRVQDAMLKAAEVSCLMARTICSGKYIILVGGQVGPVRASVQAGMEQAEEGVIDNIVIPSIHPQVFQALGDMVQLNIGRDQAVPSMGVVETFSASSALEAADAAVKAADITLFRIHLAMALGGKGLVMFSGSVGDCRSGVEAASAVVRDKGLLVATTVIPRPSRELFGERL